MKWLKKRQDKSKENSRRACLLCGVLFVLLIGGCGGSSISSTVTTSKQSLQTYLAPFVVGSTDGNTAVNSAPQTYTIDDTTGSFSQSSYAINAPQQEGAHIVNSGSFSVLSRGLLNLGIASTYDTHAGTWTTYNPAEAGSVAFELADQSAGLVQLIGQPVAPLVAAVQCPNFASAQTYQYVTIPAASIQGNTQETTWNAQTETAYGSADINTSGSTVNFSNLNQFTLSGTRIQPGSSIAGACSSTSYGNTISIPAQYTVTNPGNGQSVSPPPAIAGIGPSGLLVESNGNGYTAVAPYYQPVLGAGSGAIGLPKPSQPLDISALTGAQYLGFVYGAGKYGGNSSAATGWSSTTASFGFATQPTSCSSLAAQITARGGTLANPIYGGDFSNNDPSTSNDGYGTCDLVIDLGTQDTSNNGLYPKATIWMGGSFIANSSKTLYQFPAVAIAGKLGTKYGIFLIGLDSTQPWGIYLLQSK
jgi:hypothetical protein